MNFDSNWIDALSQLNKSIQMNIDSKEYELNGI